MNKSKKTKIDDPLLKELDTIKRLLTLFLIKSGTSQDEISMALQVDRSSVSRMFPSRKVKIFNEIDK